METEKIVKAKIEGSTGWANIPMNETLFNMGIDAVKLRKAQDAIQKFWGTPVELSASDTVYSITDKIKRYAKN